MNTIIKSKTDLYKQGFNKNIDNFILAIQMCREKGLVTQALILLYSAIDTFAWLIRDKSKEDSDKKDFIGWVKKYLLSNAKIPGTANDLYAARCGLIHSNSPEALLIRKGEAVPIYYCYGIANKYDLKGLLIKTGRSSTHVINFDDLFEAFKQSIINFKNDIENNTKLSILVYDRVGKNFCIETPEFIKTLNKLFPPAS